MFQIQLRLTQFFIYIELKCLITAFVKKYVPMIPLDGAHLHLK